MVAQTADEAVGNAYAWKSCDPGMCLYTVQEWCESPHRYPDAATQWHSAAHRHYDDNPPYGAPVFWTGGAHGYGHVAISLGGRRIRSTDATSTRDVSDVDLSWPRTQWGLAYAGWTDDLGDVDLPYLTKPPSGVFGMTLHKFARDTDQTVNGGDWHGLFIDDDGAQSLVSGPTDAYLCVTHVRLENLPAGAAAQFRYVAVDDYPGDTPTKLITDYPVTEVVGTDGSTFGAVIYANNLADADDKDATRKIRLQINAPDGAKVTVNRISVRAFVE